MASQDRGEERNGPHRGLRGLASRMARTILWVALATLAVLAVAVGGGLWLDHRLGTRPAFTISFVLVSFPITLLFTLRIVSWTTRPLDRARSENAGRGAEDGSHNLRQT